MCLGDRALLLLLLCKELRITITIDGQRMRAADLTYYKMIKNYEVKEVLAPTTHLLKFSHAALPIVLAHD